MIVGPQRSNLVDRLLGELDRALEAGVPEASEVGVARVGSDGDAWRVRLRLAPRQPLVQLLADEGHEGRDGSESGVQARVEHLLRDGELPLLLLVRDG